MKTIGKSNKNKQICTFNMEKLLHTNITLSKYFHECYIINITATTIKKKDCQMSK